MCRIGQRLAEERKRLGYNQKDFGALGGIALRTVIDWEKDKTSPNAVFLATIAKIGADVLYILTGQRGEFEKLPRREEALLDNYRNSDEKNKKVIEQVALIAAKPQNLDEDSENKKAS